MPQDFSIENYSINLEYLQNKTGEIAAGAYSLSVVEIRKSVRQIGASPPLFVNDYVLGLIWRNGSSIFLFDSHNKVENGNLSSCDTVVFLNLDTLNLPQSYIMSFYYNS